MQAQGSEGLYLKDKLTLLLRPRSGLDHDSGLGLGLGLGLRPRSGLDLDSGLVSGIENVGVMHTHTLMHSFRRGLRLRVMLRRKLNTRVRPDWT